MLAWASGCLKSWKNDHFALSFDFVSKSNKQPSKPTKSWMNLSYWNKNISKCTLYIKQLDLSLVYKKNYYKRKISTNILIPKITEIWHLSVWSIRKYMHALMIVYFIEMSMKKCINAPKCGVSRYKVKDDDECSSDESTTKGPSSKVLWYLPIIPRFKHLFANTDDTKDLTWHADGRNCDGMLCHAADSSLWNKINRLYPNFRKEARNLRLGLATDGMIPYGSLSTQHSLWSVLLFIYNLPLWLCMKQKYMMLSMTILGSR